MTDTQRCFHQEDVTISTVAHLTDTDVGEGEKQQLHGCVKTPSSDMLLDYERDFTHVHTVCYFNTKVLMENPSLCSCTPAAPMPLG